MTHYAPYIEYGTEVHASSGNGRKDSWVYKDEKTGKPKLTNGIPPQHMLKRAVTEHTDEYKKIIKKTMKANS